MGFILAAISFVILHNIEGLEVAINPEQITSLTHARDTEGRKLLVDGVRCAVGLTNGKFISVVEECDEVQARINAGGR